MRNILNRTLLSELRQPTENNQVDVSNPSRVVAPKLVPVSYAALPLAKLEIAQFHIACDFCYLSIISSLLEGGAVVAQWNEQESATHRLGKCQR